MTGFIDGVTQLPRELIGGAATALGANPEGTREFLGLEDNSDSVLDAIKADMNPESVMAQVESDPAKFIGELIPYVFLPTRLFGKAAGAALKKKAKITDKTSDKVKANVEEVAQLGLAFGAFGGVHEAAKASLEDRESDIMGKAITDGLFTIGFASLAKGAFIGAQKFKDKASQSKHIKDVFLDAGMPPKISSDISKLSEADQRALSMSFDQGIGSVKGALKGITSNVLPSAKYKPTGRKKDWVNDFLKGLGVVKDDAAEDFKKSIEKVALKDQTDRPIVIPKGNTADEAKEAIGTIRMTADDLDSHLGIMGRHSNNVRTHIIEMLPDPISRQRVTQALDVNGEDAMKALAPHERDVALKIRGLFDDMGAHLHKEGIIKGFRKEYVPHVLNKTGAGATGVLDEILESVAKRSHMSTTSARGKRRAVEDVPLHLRPDAKTTDIAELVNLYTMEVARATAMKNIFKKMELPDIQKGKNPVISLEAKDGFIEVVAETHPSLITNYLKETKAVKPFVLKVRKEETKKLIGAFRDNPQNKAAALEQNIQKRLDKELPEVFEELRQSTKLYIHQDYKPSLDMLMEANNISDLMKGVVFANFASKRALITGSLFHFNALAESALYAGAGGMGAAVKGAGVGFLITGANPLGAAVGAGLGAGAHVLVRTKNIAAQLRGGKYGDTYDYAQRYLDLRPPRDVGSDEFYNGLSGVQATIDKYVPTNTAKGILKKGTKAFGGINKTIDILMWHRLMSGAKITVFERNLEKLVLKNRELPKSQQRSQHDLATVAGQFTNDAFGGQNWRKLAEGVDNQFGRKWAAAASSEKGKMWSNLALFAPDWTVSNLRVLAKAFPMINNDKLSRQMYQRYALRAAMYYAIIGSSIQYILTGNHMLQNDDPTKLDLGDGRTMTFSKQLMEPFHWISDPVHEAVVKQSSGLKLVEEFATNKQWIGGGNNTPKIWEDDDSPLERVGNSLQVAGRHFAPIFVQDIGRNGPEGIYGFFGHPIYGNIRHGFKNSDGKIDTEVES